MKTIVAFVRQLLGLEPTVEKITAPIAKIVTKLEQFQWNQMIAAGEHEAEAAFLTTTAAAKRIAAEEAAALARHYDTLVGKKAA